LFILLRFQHISAMFSISARKHCLIFYASPPSN